MYCDLLKLVKKYSQNTFLNFFENEGKKRGVKRVSIEQACPVTNNKEEMTMMEDCNFFFLEINSIHLSTIETEMPGHNESLIIPSILNSKDNIAAFNICSSANTSRAEIHLFLQINPRNRKAVVGMKAAWCNERAQPWVLGDRAMVLLLPFNNLSPSDFFSSLY